jgi:3-hydroxyacyl-CoA dehydrogenase
MKRINKVAVLGAGTMGARIAAHFANAGVPSYLLDIVPPDADAPARNKIAAAGLDAARKANQPRSWILHSPVSLPSATLTTI